jgi:hypothetical protein
MMVCVLPSLIKKNSIFDFKSGKFQADEGTIPEYANSITHYLLHILNFKGIK